MKMQSCKYLISFIVGTAVCSTIVYFISEDRFLDKSIDFAQIVGVFAGLGLTAISIMAALPLDGWIRSAGKRNTEHKKILITEIKKIPSWFQENLIVQMVALISLIMIALLVKPIANAPSPLPTSSVIANGMVGGCIIVSAHAVLVLFSMMKSLINMSFMRFDE
jgi:hypothetical protein